MVRLIKLDCYYSLSSPWAYFAGPRLQDIVRRHRAQLTLKPYDFQAVVPKTGGVPLRTRPEPRRRYHEVELDRWRKYLGMPLVLKPKHYPQQMPADPDWNKYAGWMVIAAQAAGLDAFPLSHAILRALWAEERDIARPRCARPSPTRTATTARDCWRPRAASPCSSSIAVLGRGRALGVFGAPTFVVEGELFWGQDRLDFVDRKLDAIRWRDQQGRQQA